MSQERSRCDDAIDWMRVRIEDGTWPLNSRIPIQSHLVKDSGFAFAVVRQAVKVLISNGILESARGRGTFVRERSALSATLLSHLDTQPPQWTFSLRRALETEAAGLAATQHTEQQLDLIRDSLALHSPLRWTTSFDPATGRTGTTPNPFHSAVFAAANPLLGEIHRSVLAALRHAPAHRPTDRQADHVEIFEAIRRGDAEAARGAAGRHVGHGLLLDRDVA
ncbi:FadR/GntR family transcriptional regulator [Lentzea sp. NPDC058450]|uniref:FadR/GntR family transcriptional regulator n=1 Tax=Lentzea sp. NPDC058450 TaxID=3346505 RepID=UPI0036655D84